MTGLRMRLSRPTLLAALVLYAASCTGTSAAAASENPAEIAIAPAMQCGPVEYPLEAVQYGLEGTAQIEYGLTKDGSTRDITVKRSSGWQLLDDATVSIFASCKVAQGPVGDTARRHVIAYVWSLDAPPSRQRLVPNSCAASDRFAGFKPLDQTASGADGVLVRALIRGTGEPHYVKAERGTVPAELADGAVAYLRTCKFALAPGKEGPRDRGIFGRVLLK